ncbi:MAG: ABC transporter permease [Armatimonadetes bacterium]|nr:ABC transporter permease [Armatimonadota bacterium]
MLRFIVQRLFDAIFVILGVSFVVFIMVHLSGDPVLLMLPLDASTEQVQEFRQRLGFNDPLPVQYARFMWNVAHGDFGTSLRFDQPALRLVTERLPYTIRLAAVSLTLAACFGIPTGVIAAVWRGRGWDVAVRVVALLGQAVPIFWLGIMLILVFGERLHVLPTSGVGSWQHFVLPSVSLAAYSAASISRLQRSAMLEVLGQEYVRTAHAKGLPRRVVVTKHALRNALIPVITIMGLQMGTLLGGAVITETIFAWPGVGRLSMQAIQSRDYVLVQAAVFIVATIFVLINLVVDLLYAVLDPRIHYD